MPAILASGHTGPWPLEPKQFPSHGACVAHLEALYDVDKTNADPRPLPEGKDGTTLQRIVHSQGIERVDRNTARYTIHLGRQFRIPRPDINAIRTTYAYQERSWKCVGGRLSGEGRGGNYLDGFEYLQPPAKP
ncbi:MAG: hypothetical protein EON93_08000 [Burkholderiales bacterium]|nr:MAG: hypothetical protein EON93_08000 [Burkholderiales bacterium]